MARRFSATDHQPGEVDGNHACGGVDIHIKNCTAHKNARSMHCGRWDTERIHGCIVGRDHVVLKRNVDREKSSRSASIVDFDSQLFARHAVVFQRKNRNGESVFRDETCCRCPHPARAACYHTMLCHRWLSIFPSQFFLGSRTLSFGVHR